MNIFLTTSALRVLKLYLIIHTILTVVAKATIVNSPVLVDEAKEAGYRHPVMQGPHLKLVFGGVQEKLS